VVQEQRTYYSYHPQKRRGSRLLVLIALIAILFIGSLLTISFLVARNTTDPQNVAHTSLAAVPKVDPKVVEANNLQTAWQQALVGHQGDIGIAVYDNQTGTTAHYETTTTPFNTASAVKLSILEAILVKAQAKGTGLTSSQLANATAMIQHSDNDSATALWLQVGNGTGMNAFFKQLGTTSTTASTTWGLTQTTALDQLLVLNAFAYPSTVLTTNSAQTVTSLLQGVEKDQVWGVSAGLPAGVSVELKNGWLPDNQTQDIYESAHTWTVTSLGHVHGENQDYTIAVLTNGQTSEASGINVIESLSTITWQTLTAK
jgi:hypothetical protein